MRGNIQSFCFQQSSVLFICLLWSGVTLAATTASAQRIDTQETAVGPAMRSGAAPVVRSDAVVDQSLSPGTLSPTRSTVSVQSATAQEVSLRPESEAIIAEGMEAGEGRFDRLPIRGTVFLREGYDTNPQLLNSNPVASWFTSFGGSMSYDMSTPRTQINFDLVGSTDIYYDSPGDTVIGDVAGRVTLEHKVSPRLTLDGSVYFTYSQDPDYQIPGSISQNVGEYFYSASSFSANYQWSEKVSTTTEYALNTLTYQNAAAAFANDRLEHFFIQGVNYLLQPTTTLNMQFRYNYQQYLNLDRDSMSYFLLSGLTHNFSPRFTGNFLTGVEFREYDNPLGGSSTRPYFESNLSYDYGAFSQISWNNRYSLEAPDQVNQRSRTVYTTGLNVRHGITARLMATAGVGFSYNWNDDNVGQANFEEQNLDLDLGLSYAINRLWSMNLGYTYSQYFSPTPTREYDRNQVFLGAAFNY